MAAPGRITLLVAVLLALPANASADTIRVAKSGNNDLALRPRKQSTLRATIASRRSSSYPTHADDGDTILIGPGHFEEEVDTTLRLNFVGAGSGGAGRSIPLVTRASTRTASRRTRSR